MAPGQYSLRVPAGGLFSLQDGPVNENDQNGEKYLTESDRWAEVHHPPLFLG